MRIHGGASTLKIELIENTYVLTGSIDEQAKFDSIPISDGILRLDMRAIDSISSIGIRKWIRFVERVASSSLRLVACPPPMVSMFNAVPSAIGGPPLERVVSVLVPYSCKGCNFYHEAEVAVTALVHAGDLNIPDHVCSSCGHPTRILTDIDEYFYFLVADD